VHAALRLARALCVVPSQGLTKQPTIAAP
jgi:hypothetical protein